MDGLRVLDLAGLQSLVDELTSRGYTVLGPAARNGAIAVEPITSVDQLPRGVGDEQDAAHYRLRQRDDEKLFGFAAGAQSAKPVFFPADELLGRVRRGDAASVAIEPAPQAAPTTPAGAPPYALLGVRSCDLRAIGIQDAVLTGRRFADPHYAARRDAAFVVAVGCTDPGGTCFCASMGTGPSPRENAAGLFDLALTELLDDGGHRFVVDVGSARGAEVVDALDAAPATARDARSAEAVLEDAAAAMGRSMDTRDIKDLLYANAEHPRWDDVAARCLACTNCTLVCPTCFCTSIEDVTDLTGVATQRHRVWDSCFSADFSYIHGGVVRDSTRSRYRQWMTHKLASWIDQFGTSGCVGCGRCITWCPAAIDITQEVAAIRASSLDAAPGPAPGRRPDATPAAATTSPTPE